MEMDLEQIGFLHPTLRFIIRDLESNIGPFKCTSLWRGGGGIHDTIPLRAVDISCHAAIVGRAIKEWINSRWEYDPERREYEVCLYHGEPVHIHLQCHRNTRRRPFRGKERTKK